MCGFIGWFQSSGQLDAGRQRQLTTALQGIIHRGPDDGHEVRGEDWYMGFRRLAILDLSPAGRQPMSFNGGRHVLTFNGEIYNYRLLREARGDINFHSTGDTEVLGTMLSREPVTQVLEQLRGMFAFAWWDAENKELVAARDHFGIKPLYYSRLPDGTLFISSELRVMRPLLAGGNEISKTALAQYFRWGSVQAPETMMEGVHSLPPGHLLRWKAGELTVERYFTPRWPGAESWTTGVEAQKLTRAVITNSVKAHLVSDVPVGVFLSGGLDSTLMAALMREQGMENIQAFSIGYEQDAGVPDESDAAERTAKFLGCQFHRERLTSRGLFDHLDAYLGSLDQPTGDALNTWLVSRVAAQHVKVTLSGLGADEWFAGYNYHRLLQLAQQVPLAGSGIGRATAPLVRSLHSFLPVGLQNHKLWKAVIYASGAAGSDLPTMHAQARTIFGVSDIAALLSIPLETAASRSCQGGVRDSLLAELKDRAPGSWLQQLLMLETETYLANTLLRDNDVTSMAHSLELRVPLVDREVFDLAGRIAPGDKLNLSGGKRVIRAAFDDLLPEWIRNDTHKKTFTLPLMKWMREPAWKTRIMDVLTSQRCRERGWMDVNAVNGHLKRYFDSSQDDKRAWQLSQPVWLMFVLESWACDTP